MSYQPKHRTIPVFIPEMACPFRCIYCNQFLISGQQSMLTDEDILYTISQHLATFNPDTIVELGFFGGTFTGLPLAEQERLLLLVQPFRDQGLIRDVRLSTRPDYINDEVVRLLVRYKVRTVELGVQSMDDEVLSRIRRGYSSDVVRRVAKLLQDNNIEVGMQMMVGLPGDTPQKALSTAREIIALGATNTRIYPTLVMRQTALATQFERGLYRPLSLSEAVQYTAPILKLFVESGVTVLRVGLCPTEGLISGADYLAGPFHVSFKELVLSAIWNRQLQPLVPSDGTVCDESLQVAVSPQMYNAAIGYGSENRRMLESYFTKVTFQRDSRLTNFEFTIVNKKG